MKQYFILLRHTKRLSSREVYNDVTACVRSRVVHMGRAICKALQTCLFCRCLGGCYANATESTTGITDVFLL